VSGFQLEPGVSDQLDGIYEYTAEQWGEDQADDYISGFFAFFARIASRDVTWRTIPTEFEVGGHLGKFEHHFVYWRTLNSGDVGIVAVLHERMHQISRIRELFESG
jgi:toxin ParE1/3/4